VAQMTVGDLARLQARGGPALRKYDRLAATGSWPRIAQFGHDYVTDPASAEAAAAAEEAAAKDAAPEPLGKRGDAT
jgi:hypothetical protein